MKTRRSLWPLCAVACLTLSMDDIQGQASVPGNFGSGTNFSGWDINTGIPLEVRHNGNFPIQWFTVNTQRMWLNATQTGQTVNSYTGLDLSGHLGIGTTVPSQILTFLHINDNATFLAGYRPWMRTGLSMSEQTDWMYAGTKRESEDRIDAVINWGDNKEADPTYGPDALRFIFTRDPVLPNTVSSLDGLEIARMIPAADGNQGFVGIGDYFNAGVDPVERLDILDGKVRVRDLPTDPVSASMEAVVVNTTTGVLEHRPFPTTTGGTNCEWIMSNISHNNVCTAYGPADPNCPDDGDAVGIGGNLGAGASPGKLFVKTTGGLFHDGLHVIISNPAAAASGGVFKVDGIGSVRGVVATTHGATSVAVAGDFQSFDNSPYATGVIGLAEAGTVYSVGVEGTTKASATFNYGMRAQALGNGPTNAGIVGAHFPGGYVTPPPTGNCGVYGITKGQTLGTDRAGYFKGQVEVTGIGVIPGGVWVPSDEDLKENIEDLPNGSEVIAQLNPKSYGYRADALPQGGLPAGQQYGFLAQELEQVIPEAVKDLTFQAQLDSAGQEVYPAVPTKIVNTNMVIPFLVAAVKEQQVLIAQQNARIDQLVDQVNNCCAAPGGMAPQNGNPNAAPTDGLLQEQRLLIVPNPVADLTRLEYYVPKSGKVSLQVSDNDGKHLATLREEMAQEGPHNYSWNTSDLAAGTYFCTYMLDGAVVVKRAVKVK